MSDDTELLEGLRRRDPQAFAAFFEAYADRVYRLAVGVLGDDADGQEVVQATFLSALEAIDRFEPRAALGTWLYRIAHNHALMLVRRRRPIEAMPEEDGPLPLPSAMVDWTELPERQLLGAEARGELRAAIAGLPVGLRAAFVLRDVEGLSTAECAQVQGITEAACKVRLHRARLALRERLSAYFREWLGTAAASRTDARRDGESTREQA